MVYEDREYMEETWILRCKKETPDLIGRSGHDVYLILVLITSANNVVNIVEALSRFSCFSLFSIGQAYAEVRGKCRWRFPETAN